VGIRIAEVLIATTADPGLKASYEQDRTNIVRSTAQSCINGKWDEALRACFMAAKTQEEVNTCKGRVRAPGTPGAPAAAPPPP
jgi:hypothetical protein